DDGGQEAVDLVLGQADAVVGEDEGRRLGAAAAGYLEGDLALVGGLEVGAGADGVHAVLQQLAQEDLGTAVEVVGQQVDDATQVDLELVVHGGRLGLYESSRRCADPDYAPRKSR